MILRPLIPLYTSAKRAHFFLLCLEQVEPNFSPPLKKPTVVVPTPISMGLNKVCHTISNKWKWVSLSHVRLFATPRTIHTVYGILQARILEWVAFPFSRGSSQLRYRTQVSHIAGRLFTSWVTREAQPKAKTYFLHSFFDYSNNWLFSKSLIFYIIIFKKL